MRIFVKDAGNGYDPVRDVTVPDHGMWLEFVVSEVNPEDLNLSSYIVRRIVVYNSEMTVYVNPKEVTRGKNRHNPDPS